MSNSKSIEQLLREGVRPEDLKMQLDDEIAKAKDKIEAEKVPALKEIRHKLVENAIEYRNDCIMTAINLISCIIKQLSNSTLATPNNASS